MGPREQGHEPPHLPKQQGSETNVSRVPIAPTTAPHHCHCWQQCETCNAFHCGDLDPPPKSQTEGRERAPPKSQQTSFRFENKKKKNQKRKRTWPGTLAQSLAYCSPLHPRVLHHHLPLPSRLWYSLWIFDFQGLLESMPAAGKPKQLKTLGTCYTTADIKLHAPEYRAAANRLGGTSPRCKITGGGVVDLFPPKECTIQKLTFSHLKQKVLAKSRGIIVTAPTQTNNNIYQDGPASKDSRLEDFVPSNQEVSLYRANIEPQSACHQARPVKKGNAMHRQHIFAESSLGKISIKRTKHNRSTGLRMRRDDPVRRRQYERETLR